MSVAPGPEDQVISDDVQVDIIIPGRRIANATLFGVNQVQSEHSGLCVAYRGVAFTTNKTGYNVNKYFPYETRVYWNAEVTDTAISSNGQTILLSPQAQDKIKAVYNGSALRVELSKVECCENKCCDGHSTCSCGGPCIHCERPIFEHAFSVFDIYFAKKDVEAKWSPLATWLCLGCVSPCLSLMENKISIDIRDISIKGLNVKQWLGAAQY